MVKRTGKVANIFIAILMAIVGIGIGGLFLNGTFLSVWLLSYLPQVIHTIVGWTVIVLTILSLIFKGINL